MMPSNPVWSHFSKTHWFLVPLVAAFGLFTETALSQINLKIAYDGAWSAAPRVNEILDQYNTVNASVLNEPVAGIHWMHGIDMGIRYHLGPSAIDLSWESLGNTTTAVELSGDSGTEKTLYFRLNHLSLANEFLMGPIGMGASLDLGFYRMESRLSGTSARRKLASGTPLASRFFVSLYIRGSDTLRFVIRPYYRYQWTDALPVSGLSEYLTGQTDSGKEKFHHFGLSFCFYNGATD